MVLRPTNVGRIIIIFVICFVNNSSIHNFTLPTGTTMQLMVKVHGLTCTIVLPSVSPRQKQEKRMMKVKKKNCLRKV